MWTQTTCHVQDKKLIEYCVNPNTLQKVDAFGNSTYNNLIHCIFKHENFSIKHSLITEVQNRMRKFSIMYTYLKHLYLRSVLRYAFNWVL